MKERETNSEKHVLEVAKRLGFSACDEIPEEILWKKRQFIHNTVFELVQASQKSYIAAQKAKTKSVEVNKNLPSDLNAEFESEEGKAKGAYRMGKKKSKKDTKLRHRNLESVFNEMNAENALKALKKNKSAGILSAFKKKKKPKLPSKDSSTEAKPVAKKNEPKEKQGLFKYFKKV